MPVEPPPTAWRLEPPPDDHAHDLWAVGADLEPGTLVAAYRLGLFPMQVEGALGWWSPGRRAHIPLARRLPRTVRRASIAYEIRVDTAFDEVIRGCAGPERPGGWIDAAFVAAYSELHRLGWAHSVEAWDGEGLAGGLYGVGVGGLFAAESMFHRRSGASKAALGGLVELLRHAGAPERRLLDVQWLTPHLVLVGAEEVSRGAYHERLAEALRLPDAFGGEKSVVPG